MATYSPSKITKDGNTYNFTDATKIPLAGTNALAGSIIPATDNAYDFGDSSHNYKIVYAKEIRHGLSSGSLVCSGGNGTANGANLVLYGTDRSDGFQGRFDLVAKGSSDYKLTGLPSGKLVWGGTAIVPSTDNGCNLGSTDFQFNTVYTSNIINHGTGNELSLGNTAGGADMSLCPKGYNAGFFRIRAFDGTTRQSLNGYANGTLTWGSKNVAMQEDVVPRSGGAVITGSTLGRNGDTGILDICGGTQREHGAYIALCGASYIYDTYAGLVRLNAYKNSSNSKGMELYPNGTWTWNGSAVQITSDQRFKQQITEIDDKLLDAWEDVSLVQFKYNDAVDQKGKSARLHTGYVVQQIDKACKEHGVDVSAYGLYCHEQYPEETEEVEIEQANGTKTKEKKVIREASEHYSLRYTECLVVECAYLRKKLKELTARIEELEKENNSK